MHDQYLWDRTGQPDSEIVQLEQQLKGLAWRESATPLECRSSGRKWWALAAALLLGVLGVAILQRVHRIQLLTSWQWSTGGAALQPLHIGEWIHTAANSHATVIADAVGRIEVDPNSRLRLLTDNHRQQRVALQQGTIHALIWSPPAQFVVDTPSARTVDLGCQYSLSVSPDGDGFLKVEIGWVAFESHRLESFIPAGAACTTHLGRGPDTPYFLDASQSLVNSLTEFDRSGSKQALTSLLAAARPRDALTLWHLMERTRGVERRQVFSRFTTLVHVPPNVNEASIVNGDRQSFDLAWNALQLGDTSWWREWKRNW
jgi:hypothetical protein